MDFNNNQETTGCLHYEMDKNSNTTMLFPLLMSNHKRISHTLVDQATTTKACGDTANHANYYDDIYKEPEEYRQSSSRVKRQRTLQFNHQNLDEAASPTLKQIEVSLEDIFQEAATWTSVSCDNLDQSSEAWLGGYYNDTNINISTDDINLTEAADLQIDVTEVCNIKPVHEVYAVPQHVSSASAIVIFKGMKSILRTPTKLASSVAYPFAFVKPCGVQRGVTLREINQRIHIPTPSKSKESEDTSASFPKAAFSGKPIVGKRKIHTRGGKGSFTIMRTKG